MPFDDLSALIHQLNIHDDAIIMDSKIRDLADYFQNVFEDKQQLKDVLQHFNRLALADSKFAMNLALFFASRILNTVLTTGSQVRFEMLNVLQQNYADADTLKRTNLPQFHNSITLLGEYYHRVRVAASPVKILGQSLMLLLAEHLRADIDEHLRDATRRPDVRYAKLILRQISLNGQLARADHAAQIEELLFEVRRCLVLVVGLCATTRALLLMTLDLYYNNFGNLGASLEALYMTYLNDEEEEVKKWPAAAAKATTSTPSVTVPIGVQAHASVESAAVNSINGLSTELSKQGSGYQRPAGIKTEFLNRPLKAADRLRFVRKQTTAELEQDSEELREKERSFEQTVQQRQNQQQQQQHRQQRPPQPPQLSPQAAPLRSPSNPNIGGSNQNHNQLKPHNSPRSTTGGSSPPTSTHTTPTKTPSSARRRPLVTPVTPPQNSDWFAEVEQHFSMGVQQGLHADQTPLPLSSPEENRKNHGNGSPNKYSKSVSPNSGGGVGGGLQSNSLQRNGQSFSRSHDGNENNDNLSPGKSQHRGSRRGGRNKSRRNINVGERGNEADSVYASKSSLHSSVSSVRPASNGVEARNNSDGNNGTQLKPANRNNPFDRRGIGKQQGFTSSKHSQHCDRSEPSADDGWRRANHSSDDQISPPAQHQNAGRNPHAAQYAREFLQFLDD